MIDIFQDRTRFALLMVIITMLGATWLFLSRVPAAATTNGAPPPSPYAGFSAPDFTLELLGGGEVTLSELRSKVVIINIWASWCPPCRAEMPAIEKVYRSYKDLGLEVLGVNTTNQDSETEVAAFIQELGLSFPIPMDRTGAVGAAYNLRALPTTFFIDRKGVIREAVIGGPMSEAMIQSKVERLLREDE